MRLDHLLSKEHLTIAHRPAISFVGWGRQHVDRRRVVGRLTGGSAIHTTTRPRERDPECGSAPPSEDGIPEGDGRGGMAIDLGLGRGSV